MLSMMQQRESGNGCPLQKISLLPDMAIWAFPGIMGWSGAVAESMVVGLPTRLRDLSGWNAHRMGGFIHLLGNPA